MTSIARTNLVVPVNFPLISKRALEKSPELSKKINVFGKVLRDTLFYPLNRLQGKERKNEAVCKQLQNEEDYYSSFWTGQGLNDLNLECADVIRQNYVVRDQPVVVSLENGKKIISICRIVESKDCPQKDVFNAFLIPGNLSKLNNNLMPFYDFLVAHSKQADPSPLRFFVFGHYEMLTEIVAGDHESYKPPSLDASGEVLKRTIEALQDKFGKFDLITGHSLGCIALASLLKRSGPDSTLAFF